MSVSDLIDRGLFAENPNQANRKFNKLRDLPNEIKYKRKQYDLYKNLGNDKASYLEQMLIRVAIIREWHKYQHGKLNFTFFHILVEKELDIIFQAIINLIWGDIFFSVNDLPTVFKRVPTHTIDINAIQSYINWLSNSLIAPIKLQPYEENTEYIKEKFLQPAEKIETPEDIKKFPSSNILICLNPMSDTKTLTKSVADIIHREKQRLAKNEKNRGQNLLNDKEYNTFVSNNILFSMDIYLYAKIFNLKFSDELWAKIVLNKDNLNIDERQHLIDNCRKYRQKFEYVMLNGITNEDKDIEFQDYVQKIQHMLRSEIIKAYAHQK